MFVTSRRLKQQVHLPHPPPIKDNCNSGCAYQRERCGARLSELPNTKAKAHRQEQARSA